VPGSVLAIRREDKNIWERRVALTPEAVGQLVKEHGMQVLLQPAPRRVFTDVEYEDAGASVHEDLAPADVVLAIKEVPTALLLPEKTYMFFSHTIKGQAHNMAMLRRLMELRCNLIDYERVVDDQNRRLIFFGWYAGVAGMVETLWMLNQRLRLLGHESPFRGIKHAYEYVDMNELEASVKEAGQRIHEKGLPQWITPFVCGFLGYGHVSRGAQHVYDLLPTVEVAPGDLAGLAERKDLPRDRLMKVVFHEVDLVEPIDPARRFDLQEYYDHPSRYESIFERHVVHLHLLINGVFWTEAYPRFLTRDFLKRWFEGKPQPKLLGIGDITCDIDGSLACTVRSTEPDKPCFVYDPCSGEGVDGLEGPGVPVMAVDNLPCELPREASRTFSAVLSRFVPDILKADFSKAYQEIVLPEPIRRALILRRGELTPPYGYLERFVKQG
jgi:saccharopine dehydrogenase (NAD+, L-lysine forming)